MTIVHFTSVHSPHDMRVFRKECRTLADAGYDVVLVAPADEDEQGNGIRIRAVPRCRHRLARMTLGVWRIWRKAVAEKGAVYHFHDPELLPVGVILRLCGKKVVYDVHEDYPKGIQSKPWIPRPLRYLVSILVNGVERLCARFCHRMVVVTPSIGRRFDPRRTVLVQNFAMCNELGKGNPVPMRERRPWVTYVGGLELIRGLREMVSAVASLPAGLDARLQLGGTAENPEVLSSIVRDAGKGHVDCLGFLSRDKVADLCAQSRAGLLLFHPVPNHVEAQPTKMYEYMAAGLPVIASDFPLWRKVIDEARCGICVDPTNVKAIAAAIQWILEHPDEAQAMGQRGQEAMRTKYCWEQEARKLVAMYAELTGHQARAALD